MVFYRNNRSQVYDKQKLCSVYHHRYIIYHIDNGRFCNIDDHNNHQTTLLYVIYKIQAESYSGEKSTKQNVPVFSVEISCFFWGRFTQKHSEHRTALNTTRLQNRGPFHQRSVSYKYHITWSYPVMLGAPNKCCQGTMS